jgi:hypothetical protein
MDDDPVLRSLSADLERDDPALAALLSGRTPPVEQHPTHRHSAAWLLLALPLLVLLLLLPLRMTLGLLAMSLILSSPAIACWLCAATEGPATRRT